TNVNKNTKDTNNANTKKGSLKKTNNGRQRLIVKRKRSKKNTTTTTTGTGKKDLSEEESVGDCATQGSQDSQIEGDNNFVPRLEVEKERETKKTLRGSHEKNVKGEKELREAEEEASDKENTKPRRKLIIRRNKTAPGRIKKRRRRSLSTGSIP